METLFDFPTYHPIPAIFVDAARLGLLLLLVAALIAEANTDVDAPPHTHQDNRSPSQNVVLITFDSSGPTGPSPSFSI